MGRIKAFLKCSTIVSLSILHGIGEELGQSWGRAGAELALTTPVRALKPLSSILFHVQNITSKTWVTE